MTQNIIEKHNRQFLYAGILMNVFIAFQFYRIWQGPMAGDANKITTMTVLIAFEFYMVHSGVLMSTTSKKVSLYLLFPFYGLFALLFNALAQDHIILIAYLLIVFNRMRFAFSDVPKILKEQTAFKSILAALAYFVLIFPFLFGAKHVPELAMTSNKMLEIGYSENSGAKGLILEMPHVAIAFGFTYYCILAIIESFSLRPRFGSPFIKYPKK